MPSISRLSKRTAMDSGRRMIRVRSARAVLLLVVPLLSLGALPAAAPGFDGRPFGRSLMSADARQLTITPNRAAVPSGFVETTAFSGINAPTSVRFADNGHVFVAEKAGRVLEYDSFADTTPTVVVDIRGIANEYEDRGLLGLALDPQYTTGRPFIYALYTYDKDPFTSQVPRWSDDCPTPPGPTADGCIVSGRLSRFTAGGPEQVLIEDWCQQYTSHSVGDLAFGPDGALYVSGGDGASYTFADYGQDGNPVNPCGDPPAARGGTMTPPTAEGGALRSQDVRTTGDPTSANGALLRVNPDTGAAMPDNPNAASPDAMAKRIVAHGFRNPFRITVRPGTNEVWVGDVGWTNWEEIDRVATPTAAMRNYGWPCYEGAGRMSSYDNANLNLCETLYAQGASAHAQPHYAYTHGERVIPGEPCPLGTSSISAISFAPTVTQFPARYRNGLFFADYSRSCIWFMPIGADGQPDPAQRETFASGAEGVVGLTAGPDGSLYYPDIVNGEIKRISYPSSNQAPTARATASPTSGPAPLTVTFDGTTSSDPNGDTLTYAWDLDGDGAFDDSTNSQPQWTYTSPGPVNARLRVSDPGGLQSITTIVIRPGTPPVATIDTPSAGLTWATGDTLVFSGHGTDGQGGALAASRLTWRMLLQHCSDGQQNCHTHVLQTWAGVAGSSFVAPDHEYPSYLELELTATDANGLTDVTKRRLDPKTVDVTFETSPTGLQLSVGSFTGSAPFTRTVIVGSNQTVSAPAQSFGGTAYVFGSWSDAGAQSHSITVPAANATYRATFTQGVTGLVGAWGFDESSGSQAQDASGRGGTGTIAGATRAAGRFGGGLTFDGIDDWVTVADSAALDLSSVMTLEAWVNPTALGATWRTAVLKENGAGLAYALYANDGANRAAGYLTTGSDQGLSSPTGAVPLNAWTHLATTYDGASLRVFANGTQVAIRALTGSISTSTGPLRFGGNGAWLNEFFQGRLDEIRVYDRALTAAQISSDMNAPIGPPAVTPQLAVTPASLTFAATQNGANPGTKSLVVANTGGGSLSYSATDDAPWLSVTPATGSAPQNLTAAVNVSGLAAGTYTATVTVTSPGVQGSPASIPVTLTVAPPPSPPQLSVMPASLSFSGTEGGAGPAAKSLAVANTGGGTLTFTASDDAPWLAVTPASGSAPQSLSVSVDTTGLAAGTYSGTVTVTSSGVQGSPAAIPVSLTVNPAPAGPALSVAPATLSFNATAGGATPAAKTLDVSNTGGGTLSFTASDDAPWLTVAPASGLAPQALTVSANPAGLAASTYTATVTVSASGASGSPKTVPVSFTVAPAPPQTGLVAAYGFDETSGSTVNDASPGGNPGMISGAARITTGRSGGALSFDGVNDWVTVADAASLDFTAAMTMEAWVYPTTLAGAWRTVILKERTNGLAYALYAADSGNRPIAYSFTTSELGARGTTALPANTWTHLAVTYSASTLRLFVNGTQVVTRSVGTPLQPSTLPLRIGGNAVWNEWFLGRIDEVRLYNRALAATEIQSDMTRPVTAAGAASARSARPRANSRLARRNLRRARRHASVRRERARRSLPLARHAPGRRGR
jgi:glucose/arabinose dehydrogenase/PKD repeat protein